VPETVAFLETSAINMEISTQKPRTKTKEKYLTCGKCKRKKMILKREKKKLLQEHFIYCF